MYIKEQYKAEILWALKSVMSHFSYNSASDITDVLGKVMFWDMCTNKIVCSDMLWNPPFVWKYSWQSWKKHHALSFS